MQKKRRLALLIGAAAVVPALSSCMSYATDMIYTPAAGVNDRAGDIDVLNAAIVSTDGGTGRFIATLSNDDPILPGALDSMTGAGDSASLVVADFEPLELRGGGYVNLATTESAGGVGIPVAGSFDLGDFVEVSLTFRDGTSTQLAVPVLPNADEYAGIGGPIETDLERPVPEGTFLLEEEGGGEGGTELSSEPAVIPESGLDSEQAE